MTGQVQTQPSRVGPVEVREPLFKPNYAEFEPLLAAMDKSFAACLAKLSSLQSAVAPMSLSLFSDMVDSMQMTALRATQLYALYDYAAYWSEGDSPFRKQRRTDAEIALSKASSVVSRREQLYRVPVDRIAGWRANPTVYTYGYLWTVHRYEVSLIYAFKRC